MNFDTRYGNLCKSPTNALPTNTVFINLKHGKDQLLKRMKPKTRYNIRLSRRKGVQVREVDGSRLNEWLCLCRETARRNRIINQDRPYYEALLAAHDNNPDDRTSLHMLMAEAGGTPLAGMFLSISENQACYLYGASSSCQRNKMAPYALQWRAICLAKECGCRYYDMFGVAPSPSPSHPMYGLYRFKTGFGGFLYHRQGCWDYPFREDLYRIYHAQALNEEGYHLRQ
jgi:lipid II:glycine glycyltransferase (peptidoglycan interpeptide bridge formation enzyme)